jgi:hypothetical protein
MNRKEKYKRLRISRRINLSKYSLLAFSISSLFLFSLCIMSFGTYSYFTAQADFTFSVKNATKEELVQIEEGSLEYVDRCLAQKSVTIKNIFDYKVIISIDNTKYTLQPGEVISHTQVVADQCNEFGDRSFIIIGYENYFSHPINVIVEKDKLNPCPPQSDNGQGKPNDNGEGKQCGHTDTPGGTDDDSSNSTEAVEQEEAIVEVEETVKENEPEVKEATEKSQEIPEEVPEENKEKAPVSDEKDAVEQEPKTSTDPPEENPVNEKEQPEKQEQPIQPATEPQQPVSSQNSKDETTIVEESAS